MLSRSLAVLFALLIAVAVFAEDAVLLRFEGRGLTPDDKYTVSSTMQYVAFDLNRKVSEGAIAIDESMAEFREVSTGKAVWTLTVPQDGRYSGEETRFSFPQGVTDIPGKKATYLVTVVISRSTVAPDGKWVSFTREQAFPVSIADGSVSNELCVVFEGGAGGTVTMGVRPKCSDSVADFLPHRP